MKAFVNGIFHYSDAVSLNNDSISKTLAVNRQNELKFITFNFRKTHEIPSTPSIRSMECDQKIVNIVYQKPYNAEVVDVNVFSEYEVELLNLDSLNI